MSKRAAAMEVLRGYRGLMLEGAIKKCKIDVVLGKYCAALRVLGRECTVEAVAPAFANYLTPRQVANRLNKLEARQ